MDAKLSADGEISAAQVRANTYFAPGDKVFGDKIRLISVIVGPDSLPLSSPWSPITIPTFVVDISDRLMELSLIDQFAYTMPVVKVLIAPTSRTLSLNLTLEVPPTALETVTTGVIKGSTVSLRVALLVLLFENKDENSEPRGSATRTVIS
jgi:hypothetical protein